MKLAILLVLYSFFTITYTCAQKVLINSDTAIQITIDSTGYVERHPHDIPDNTDLFIYSADGREVLRIYVLIRLLLAWDNKKNFHAYDLTQPTLPTGVNDYHFSNSIGTIFMSRLCFDAYTHFNL